MLTLWRRCKYSIYIYIYIYIYTTFGSHIRILSSTNWRCVPATTTSYVELFTDVFLYCVLLSIVCLLSLEGATMGTSCIRSNLIITTRYLLIQGMGEA